MQKKAKSGDEKEEDKKDNREGKLSGCKEEEGRVRITEAEEKKRRKRQKEGEPN